MEQKADKRDLLSLQCIASVEVTFECQNNCMNSNISRANEYVCKSEHTAFAMSRNTNGSTTLFNSGITSTL